MKEKLKRISLHQLDVIKLNERQTIKLIGGGSLGDCKCGSCSATTNYDANLDANYNNGYTITGDNDPMCSCSNKSVVAIIFI